MAGQQIKIGGQTFLVKEDAVTHAPVVGGVPAKNWTAAAVKEAAKQALANHAAAIQQKIDREQALYEAQRMIREEAQQSGVAEGVVS